MGFENGVMMQYFHFPGRGRKYSAFEWRARHFDAVDYDDLRRADQPVTCPRFSPRGDRLGFGTPDGYPVFETRRGRSFFINGISEWGHGFRWSWSPDGAEIWFTASESGEERPLKAVSLSGRRRLLSRVPGSRDAVRRVPRRPARAALMAFETRSPACASDTSFSMSLRSMLPGSPPFPRG